MPATFPYLGVFTNVKNKRDRLIQLFTQKRAENDPEGSFLLILEGPT